MVMVKCHRHGVHSMKPTDVATMLEKFIDKTVELAFEQPLPEVAGISDPESLLKVVCPQESLNRIKSGKDFLGNPPKH